MTKQSSNRMVTQEDVARQAGVSRSVVSYVINDGPRSVSEETRHRVLTAIQELDYRPNKHARMLSSTDESAAENYIGIILAGTYMFKRPYYGSILASIHEHAHERGWHIRFIRVLDDFNDAALFNELIHPNEISGVILMSLDAVLTTPEQGKLIESIIERVNRVVCIEWEWPGVPSVMFDRRNAAYQATSHLLNLGCKSVVYAGPMDKRLQGYQEALLEGHIPSENQLRYFAIDVQDGYRVCEQLLQRSESIDGICCGTDEVAIGMLNCLHQHQVDVPGDVAVASIDNLDVSAYTVPSLSSVDVPKDQIGRHAVGILVSDESWQASSAFAITVPTQLIQRESSSRKVR
ncbi:MAG: LacI family transcriptional regulator [Anaerolineae bacterium]|nr:LacI family transcriptional regulator [Anaerolineae bacterium]